MSLLFREQYLIADDVQRDRFQHVADTGPCDTFTRVDDEQGIMRRALDQCLVHVEELVFLPFEVGAGVRAFVDITVERPVFMYHENGLRLAFDLRFEAFAAGIVDIGGFAEYVCHNVW